LVFRAFLHLPLCGPMISLVSRASICTSSGIFYKILCLFFSLLGFNYPPALAALKLIFSPDAPSSLHQFGLFFFHLIGCPITQLRSSFFPTLNLTLFALLTCPDVSAHSTFYLLFPFPLADGVFSRSRFLPLMVPVWGLLRSRSWLGSYIVLVFGAPIHFLLFDLAFRPLMSCLASFVHILVSPPLLTYEISIKTFFIPQPVAPLCFSFTFLPTVPLPTSGRFTLCSFFPI